MEWRGAVSQRLTWAWEIVKLEAKGRQDKENAKEIHANRRKLENENDAIADLLSRVRVQ